MNRQQKELRRSAAKAFIESLDQLDDVFDKGNPSSSSRSGSPAQPDRSQQQHSAPFKPEERSGFDEVSEETD